MRGLLTEAQARAWAQELADEEVSAAQERVEAALASLNDAERDAQRAEIARLRADLGDRREILLLRRLEREVRRAYGPGWEQESFSGEEVGRILDAIDVARSQGSKEA